MHFTDKECCLFKPALITGAEQCWCIFNLSLFLLSYDRWGHIFKQLLPVSKTTVNSNLKTNACVLTSVGKEICAVCALQRVYYDYLNLRVQWLGCVTGWEALAFCNSQEMGQDLAAVSLLLLFDHWPVVDCQVGSPCSVTLGAFRRGKRRGGNEECGSLKP